VIAARPVLAALLFLGLSACGAAGAQGDKAALAAGKARADLYQCEGCEGALEADAAKLASHAALAPAGEPGEPLRIEGTVYAVDGTTPAASMVIYAYQTNAAGLYANGSPETEASRRHGRLRGWVKTGADGRYSFDTIKPAPYPDDTIPAHIHFTILEEGKRPYWIDDIVFDGEFGVTDAYRRSMTNKGGNGIVPVTRDARGVWQVTRDIILERHPE
jgi:protocatechuate 3,4-dioxygenase, beta subunit